MPKRFKYDFAPTGKYNLAFGIPQCKLREADNLLQTLSSTIRISTEHIQENFQNKHGTNHSYNNHSVTAENAIAIAKLALSGELNYRIVEIELNKYWVKKALIRVDVKTKSGADKCVVMPISIRYDKESDTQYLNINTAWINDNDDDHITICPIGITGYYGDM